MMMNIMWYKIYILFIAAYLFEETKKDWKNGDSSEALVIKRNEEVDLYLSWQMMSVEEA